MLKYSRRSFPTDKLRGCDAVACAARAGRLREMGNRLTGGGVRAFIQRLFRRVRYTGDRLTGGGLRRLSSRMATKSLRIAMSQPLLKALGRSVLQPFPTFSARLCRLVTAPDTAAKTQDGVATSTSLLPLRDFSLLVNSLYRAAFGRLAEESGLAHYVHELQSGMSLESLAEDFVRSAEFRQRHGLSQEVDIRYVTALYRDGLGRPPELERLAFWLAEQEKGATRAKVLAGIAASDEALTRARLPAPETGMDYGRWVVAFDTITDADRAAIRAHIARVPFRPIISVIMPIGTTSEIALHESFNSVGAQLYPFWELCVTLDVVADPHVRAILRDWTARDPRIRMIELNTVESVATATNAALSLATGEFVAFLRAGDILSEHALYEVAFALGGDGWPDIVYSDHDQLNFGGQRANPWFKPGWDPDLLLGQDYINDLAVYRRTLLEAVGYVRPEFAGAEFHDLALRVTAASTPDRIRHIPAILYHRRGQKSAITSESALPELLSVNASRRAVRDYLDSRGNPDAIIKPAAQIPSAIRIVWPLPSPEPLVSVIIPTRDRADLLAQCIEGVLHRTDYRNLELLIVDNGSAEPATLTLFDRLVREESAVRILRHPGPFNYSALNNAAAREATGEVLLLLNNDINVIDSGWLRELVSHAIRPDVGIVGAKLLSVNDQVQHGGIVLGPDGAVAHIHRLADRNDPGYFGQLALSRTLSAVTGACAAIRRAVFFQVGGLDEVNLPVCFNDIDLCLRVGDYGYRVVWTPFAELFHLECASRGLDQADPDKRARFLREWEHMRKTWGSLLDSADPFHNPNLRFSWEHFEIPASPRRRKPWRDLGEQVLELQRHFSRAQDSRH
jgi:O-antigen biosynthesis protein